MRISDWSSDVCSSDLDPLPPFEEQPALCGRSRRGQNRHCRGPGPQDHRGRCSRSVERGRHLFTRHSTPARIPPLPLSFRAPSPLVFLLIVYFHALSSLHFLNLFLLLPFRSFLSFFLFFIFFSLFF